MTEVWKPVPGFPRYEASDQGRVRSLFGRYGPYAGPRILRDARSGQGGYRAVVLYGESGKKQLYLHQIVLLTFDGPAPPGHEGAHLDGDQTNNALENLEWVTRKVNHSHKVAHGTARRGERGTNARLREVEVQQLRDEYRFGVRGYGTQVLAEKYGISQRHAYDIVNNKRWAYSSDVSRYPGLSATAILYCGAI